MDCYHGFIQPETTLQQALLDLRLFIQTEYFVTVSSCELQAVQIKNYFLHCFQRRIAGGLLESSYSERTHLPTASSLQHYGLCLSLRAVLASEVLYQQTCVAHAVMRKTRVIHAAGCFLCICPVLFLHDIFIHMCYLPSLALMPSNSECAVTKKAKINVEGRTWTFKALQYMKNSEVFKCFAHSNELMLPVKVFLLISRK